MAQKHNLSCMVLMTGTLLFFGVKAAGVDQPNSGSITESTNGTDTITVEVRSWPADGKLALPTPLPNITSARLISATPQSLKWTFNADAKQLRLEVPAKAPANLPAMIQLETTEKSAQFADGRITFSALDTKVNGSKAKLESHPGNHRIGFWTDAADSVSWDYQPTRWGMYDVELAFSAAGGDGTELAVEIAGKRFTVKRPSTSSWYRYMTMPVGRLYLENEQPFTVKVSCPSLKGGAVANLKAVTLRPAPEGVAITQAPDGIITLMASNGITHSVKMRYEPATNKKCMGYWVNPGDTAEWQFTVLKPGRFDVEFWQGCKGGGSEVGVEVGGKQLTFTVEDTGHFQNFKPRHLGQVEFKHAGVHSLVVQPKSKQGVAIMDIRQIRLLPVKEDSGPAKPTTKVEVDYSQAPECKAFAEHSQKLVEEWYPRLCELLASEGESARTDVIKLSFLPMKGVAATSGNHIKVSAEWVTKRAPNDYGMIVHELVHVVQNYHGGGEGWVTEGIADYVRDRWFEPGARKLHLNPAKATFHDGYTTTAAFLMWVEDHRCPGIVAALNAASRQRKPLMNVFVELTGQDAVALWEEFMAFRAESSNFQGPSSK